MAKIAAGALSHPSGKFGALVGATWKGIPYIREYVIPANPSTPAQVTQRQWFTAVVRMAKALLGPVLQVFWDPFIKKNSGYAKFIGRALTDMSSIVDFDSVKIADGSREGAVIASAVYSGANVTITWDETILSNGELTDAACAFVYDVSNQVGWFSSTATRDDESVAVAVGTGRGAPFLKAYLFFADDASDPSVVSVSSFLQVTL